MAAGFPVIIHEHQIRTVEALYQACRFPDHPDIQQLIIQQKSPMTAKMVGRPHLSKTRCDWDLVRIRIMRWCLRVKLAQNFERFSTVLLETGDMPIVEQSHKDLFWGARPEDDVLRGCNALGRLLMELRHELAMREPSELRVVLPPKVSNFLLLGKPVGTVYGSIENSHPASAEQLRFL